MDFTLVDQTAFVLVHKFNRIFNRDVVVMPLCVDFVEHGGQSGGLSGARGTSHQNQSARLIAQTRNNLGQIQLLKGLDLKGNHAIYRAYRAALVKTVAAEASQPFQSEREIQLQVFFKAVLLRIS